MRGKPRTLEATIFVRKIGKSEGMVMVRWKDGFAILRIFVCRWHVARYQTPITRIVLCFGVLNVGCRCPPCSSAVRPFQRGCPLQAVDSQFQSLAIKGAILPRTRAQPTWAPLSRFSTPFFHRCSALNNSIQDDGLDIQGLLDCRQNKINAPFG